MKPWTPQDEARLRELYPDHSQRECASLFGRTPKAISSRAKLLKLRRNRSYRLWTPAEDAILRAEYANGETHALAERLKRNMTMVYQRAKKIGLLKSAEYIAELLQIEAVRLRRVGVASRYQPGRTPENKGLRRPGYAPGRMAETQFKKGVRQGVAAKNWCPIGTIRADADGFLRIKVRDGIKGEAYGFGNVKIWPLLNRHVWTQHHGPIPAGHIVGFKDRDRTNCAIENLELRTLAENMRRNTVHNLPPALKQVIQLTGALKRKIRNREESLHGQEHAAGS